MHIYYSGEGFLFPCKLRCVFGAASVYLLNRQTSERSHLLMVLSRITSWRCAFTSGTNSAKEGSICAVRLSVYADWGQQDQGRWAMSAVQRSRNLRKTLHGASLGLVTTACLTKTKHQNTFSRDSGVDLVDNSFCQASTRTVVWLSIICANAR